MNPFVSALITFFMDVILIAILLYQAKLNYPHLPPEMIELLNKSPTFMELIKLSFTSVVSNDLTLMDFETKRKYLMSLLESGTVDIIFITRELHLSISKEILEQEMPKDYWYEYDISDLVCQMNYLQKAYYFEGLRERGLFDPQVVDSLMPTSPKFTLSDMPARRLSDWNLMGDVHPADFFQADHFPASCDVANSDYFNLDYLNFEQKLEYFTRLEAESPELVDSFLVESELKKSILAEIKSMESPKDYWWAFDMSNHLNDMNPFQQIYYFSNAPEGFIFDQTVYAEALRYRDQISFELLSGVERDIADYRDEDFLDIMSYSQLNSHYENVLYPQFGRDCVEMFNLDYYFSKAIAREIMDFAPAQEYWWFDSHCVYILEELNHMKPSQVVYFEDQRYARYLYELSLELNYLNEYQTFLRFNPRTACWHEARELWVDRYYYEKEYGIPFDPWLSLSEIQQLHKDNAEFIFIPNHDLEDWVPLMDLLKRHNLQPNHKLNILLMILLCIASKYFPK